MIGITQVVFAFPEIVQDAECHGGRTGQDGAEVVEKTGISRRYFLQKGADEIDLAVAAFRKLQNKAGLDDTGVELLVYITQNPDRTMPHAAAQLISRLEMKAQPASFDISLGCSAYPYALALARGFMETQGMKRAVIVTNDPYSKLTTLDDSKTCSIFGDGSSATLLERDRGGAIGLGVFGTDGENWDVIELPKISDAKAESHILDEVPVGHAESRTIRMNGSRLVSYFSKKVPELVADTLERNGIGPNSVDILILHQASSLMLSCLKKNLPFPEETEFPVLLDDGGNTGCSSIPISLARVMESRNISGKMVMLCGFGVGLSWSAITISF